ncbi:hypothetical protein T459_30392 [Capsicum annuum]|uniref:Uncharacterized protein n=1 Tax=Capsicum annuum TaxID=4072 RepID=A0A2G2Y888_CAPAN|nr:hypothetical protein T459_30392 [Capsicum annuum]
MRHPIFHASGSVEGHWIRIPPPHTTSFDASDTYDRKEDESLFALSGIVSFQERGRGYELDTAARHGFANCIPIGPALEIHDTTEHLRQDEIEDLSLSPPTGSNGFGHNIEFMSQAYLRNRSSKIDIEVEDDTSIANKDQPLPIFLKKVKISQASPNNLVKAVVSKVGLMTQVDVLFPQLTIEEAFIFVVFLRLPSKMSRRQKYERAEVIIKELGQESFQLTLYQVTGAGEHFTKYALTANEIFEIQSEQHWIKDRNSRDDLFQDQMIHLFICLGGLIRIGQIRWKEPIKERSDALSDAVHDVELPIS